MNTILLLIGNIFMVLYAICTLVSAIVLLIDIFNSQEYKDKLKVKNLIKSMKLIRPNNSKILFNEKEINKEGYNALLNEIQVYNIYPINSVLINKFSD